MKNIESTAEPTMIEKTIEVVPAVSLRAEVRASRMAVQPSRHISMTRNTPAASAPIAADSVGVKIPEYMPPNTMKKRMPTRTTPRRGRSRRCTFGSATATALVWVIVRPPTVRVEGFPPLATDRASSSVPPSGRVTRRPCRRIAMGM
jgi:hypothetical protein